MDSKSESPLPVVSSESSSRVIRGGRGQDRDPRNFKKICILNLTVGCPLGDKCKDIHTIRTSFCKYYGSALGCKYGALCRFSHASPDSVSDCEEWFYDGWCSYGEKCIYAHDNSISWNRKMEAWESISTYEYRLANQIKQWILNEEGLFVWENCLDVGLNAPVSVTISRLTGNSVTVEFRSRRQVVGGDPDRMDLYHFQVSKITYDRKSNRWVKTPFGSIESPLHPCHEITVSNLHPRRYYCLSYSILFASTKAGDREWYCTAPKLFRTKKLDINLNDCSLKLKLLSVPLRWSIEWPPMNNLKIEIINISNSYLQFETKNILREDRYLTNIPILSRDSYSIFTQSFVLSADKSIMYLQTISLLIGESVEEVCLYKLHCITSNEYVFQNEEELLLTDCYNHRFEIVSKLSIFKDLIGEDIHAYWHSLSICHVDDSLVLSLMCYQWGNDGNVEIIQVFKSNEEPNNNLEYLWEIRNDSKQLHALSTAKDYHMDMWRDDIWKQWKSYSPSNIGWYNQNTLNLLQENLGNIYWYNPNTLFHFWNGNMYVFYSDFESQLYYITQSVHMKMSGYPNDLIIKYGSHQIDLFRNLKICQLDWKHRNDCVIHFDQIDNLLFVGDQHRINQIYRLHTNCHVNQRVEGLEAAVKVTG